MKRLLISILMVSVVALGAAGCDQAAPAAPTQAPAAPKAAAPAQTTVPAAAAPAAAPKASWPEKGKAITALIGYGAGGPTDLLTRVVSPELEKILGVPIVIANKPGASEQVATTQLVQSKPDGYTIQVQTFPIIQVTYLDPEAKAPYGRKDLTPIALMERHSSAVIVKGDSPYKSIKDLVDAAKASPEKVVWSTTGMLSTGAFPGYFLSEVTGIKLAYVNFDSGALSMQSVLGGHTDVGSVNPSIIMDQVRSGNLRVIATTGEQRNRFLPDVPTFKDQGYNVVSYTAQGIQGPAGMSAAVVDLLTSAVKTALADPDLMKKFVDTFNDPMYMNPADFSKFLDQQEIDGKKVVNLVRGTKQ